MNIDAGINVVDVVAEGEFVAVSYSTGKVHRDELHDFFRIINRNDEITVFQWEMFYEIRVAAKLRNLNLLVTLINDANINQSIGIIERKEPGDPR